MFRRSLGRHQRSKGFKVKHFVQICLLLAVCFWLIYQVKRSHEKKKEFDGHDETGKDVLKLGRKDILDPQVKETAVKNEKSEEEDEDTEMEEHNKHEEEEQTEGRNEENEDEGRGGGDDEIDENDQDKTEAEADREEDVDDEKEREDDNDEKDGNEDEEHIENDNSAEDQEQDGGGRNTHEAREEHYKGDDASSAVTHDNQSTDTESVSLIVENSNENEEQKDEFNNIESINSDQNNESLKVEEGDVTQNRTFLNRAAIEGMHNETISSKQESLLVNATQTEPSQQPEGSNNPADAKTETPGTFSQNMTQTERDLIQTLKGTDESTISGEGSNLKSAAQEVSNSSATSVDNYLSSDSTNSTTTERIYSVPMTSEKSLSADVNNGGSSSGSLKADEITHTEKPDTANQVDTRLGMSQNETEVINKTDEDSSGLSSADENEDANQHDPIDSTDSSLLQEEGDSRMDLDLLPEIRNEGSDNEDAMVE